MIAEHAYAALSPAELKKRVESGAPPVLMHVLPMEHFEQQHLPGAGVACVYEVDFTAQVKNLAGAPDPEREIVVYGVSADTRDAEMAADKLLRLGYSSVTLLEGGMAVWREAGFAFDGAAADGPIVIDPEPFFAESAELLLAPDESRLTWQGRNHNGGHWGSAVISAGMLGRLDGVVAGRFTIDMTSLENADLEDSSLRQLLIAHLSSDDFFFVERHPTAEYVLHEAREIPEAAPGQPNFQFQGELTLRGVSRSLDFPATVCRLDDGRLSIEAHFDFDRTLWDAIYGSGKFFKHLSYHLVFDAVTISLRLVVGS